MELLLIGWELRNLCCRFDLLIGIVLLDCFLSCCTFGFGKCCLNEWQVIDLLEFVGFVLLVVGSAKCLVGLRWRLFVNLLLYYLLLAGILFLLIFVIVV